MGEAIAPPRPAPCTCCNEHTPLTPAGRLRAAAAAPAGAHPARGARGRRGGRRDASARCRRSRRSATRAPHRGGAQRRVRGRRRRESSPRPSSRATASRRCAWPGCGPRSGSTCSSRPWRAARARERRRSAATWRARAASASGSSGWPQRQRRGAARRAPRRARAGARRRRRVPAERGRGAADERARGDGARAPGGGHGRGRHRGGGGGRRDRLPGRRPATPSAVTRALLELAADPERARRDGRRRPPAPARALHGRGDGGRLPRRVRGGDRAVARPDVLLVSLGTHARLARGRPSCCSSSSSAPAPRPRPCRVGSGAADRLRRGYPVNDLVEMHAARRAVRERRGAPGAARADRLLHHGRDAAAALPHALRDPLRRPGAAEPPGRAQRLPARARAARDAARAAHDPVQLGGRGGAADGAARPIVVSPPIDPSA